MPDPQGTPPQISKPGYTHIKVQLPNGETTVISVEENCYFSELVTKTTAKKRIKMENVSIFVQADGKMVETSPDLRLFFFKSIEKVLLYGKICNEA